MSLAYGTTTPLGIAIGLGVRETYDPSSATALIVQGVLDSISAGVLLYAALVELLASDFIYDSHFRKYSIIQKASAFILLIFGAGLMALIGVCFYLYLFILYNCHFRLILTKKIFLLIIGRWA